MSLYKLSDTTWGIDYRDEYGRRHRKPVGSLEAATAIEARLKEEVARAKQSVNRFALGEGLTLEGARDIWLATLPVGKLRQAHIKRTLGTLASKLGNQAAAQVTPKLLAEYAAMRAATLAPSSQAKENGTLKQFFAWLAQHWYLPTNAAAALSTKHPKRSSGISISYAEEANILEACRTLNTKLKIILALDGGLRISEIIGLRREHWNSQENTLTVFSTKNKITRLIPTTQRLEAHLKNVQHLMPGSRLICSSSTNSDSATGFLRKWSPLVSRIRFHDLRHSFASRIAAVSKPHVVGTLLGHSPRSNTDLYIHPSIEELRQAIAAMEESNPNVARAAPDKPTDRWPKPPRPEPPTKKKEKQLMPGNRYSLRITDPTYGYLTNFRFRPAADQSHQQPGTLYVESADLEGRYAVSLIHLELIVQPTTFKKEDEKPQ